MVSQRIKKHATDLAYLQKAKPCVRKLLIEKADRGLVECFCEIADNILKGNLPLTPKQKTTPESRTKNAIEKVRVSQKEEESLAVGRLFRIVTSTPGIRRRTPAV